MDLQTLSQLPPQVLAAYLRDPQQEFLTKMMTEGTDTSPIQSPWQGVARLAKAGLGAYMGGQLRGDYQKQAADIGDERKRAYALALGKPPEQQTYGDTTINWNEQKPNYSAAAAELGPGNQDFGDKIFQVAALRDASKKDADQALANAIKLKQFEYGADPAKQESLLMAEFLRSMSGQGGNPQMTPPPVPSPSLPTGSIPQMPMSGLDQPPQGGTPPPPMPSQLSAQPSPMVNQPIPSPQAPVAGQQGGFNPMGALLAKKLGLENMQIGPNGQPMPIPGTMKIEAGKVITIGPDGQPTQTVPRDPIARQSIESTIGYLSKKLDELKTVGAAVDEGQSSAVNLKNSMLSNPSMQMFQPGSKAQTIRSEMASFVMQAMPDYMSAKGITPGMERSLGGQELILKAIGIDPKNSVQASKEILSNLSKVAGTGDYNKAHETTKNSQKVKVTSPDNKSYMIDISELPQALQNGWSQSP